LSPVRVIFVDVGNTCRSLMAEVLARERFRDFVYASSAGTQPGTRADAQNAIETLRLEFGIDVSGHLPRDVHDIDLRDFDYVIAIDDDRGPKKVAQELRKLIPREIIEWRIRDPFGRGDEYKPCALKIIRELGCLKIPGGRN